MRVMPILLSLAECQIVVDGDKVTTVMPWGTAAHGMPHDTDEYRATAKRLGYGDDVARMNRTHEVTHSLVAHILGWHSSFVLARVAAGVSGASAVTQAEEDVVCALERFANMLGVDLVARAAVISVEAR